jgi:hypothetical protein
MLWLLVIEGRGHFLLVVKGSGRSNAHFRSLEAAGYALLVLDNSAHAPHPPCIVLPLLF